MSTRRCSWLAAAAIALAALFEPCAAFADCPSSKAEGAVTLHLAEPTLDNTLWQPQLQDLAGKEHHGGRTLGLYRMHMQSDVRANLRVRQAGGWLCFWIENVSISLTVSPREIYVVRERAPGTCAYNAVLGHERKHQAVDDELFNHSVPWLRQKIEKVIRNLRPEQPMQPAQFSAGRDRLNKVLNEALKSALADMEAERKDRQARIDDPSEYRRVSAACQ